MNITECEALATKTFNAYVFVSNPCAIMNGTGCGLIKYMCTNDLSVAATVDDLFKEYCWNDQKIIRDVKELSLDIEFSTARVPTNSMLMQFWKMISKTTITAAAKTEVVTLPKWSWSLDATKNMPIPINVRNADGSKPTYVVTGTVDGTLTDWVDYESTQITEDLPNGAETQFNFLELKSWTIWGNNISTLEQDIEISITYTPNATLDIDIKTWAFDSASIQIDIFAVNLDDTTDIIHINTTWNYSQFSKILSFTKNTEAPEWETIGFKIEKWNHMSIKWLDLQDCIK